jgi:hypothetical protein
MSGRLLLKRIRAMMALRAGVTCAEGSFGFEYNRIEYILADFPRPGGPRRYRGTLLSLGECAGSR